MGKVKAATMEKEDVWFGFQPMQPTLFEETVGAGWTNMQLQLKKPLEQDGNGLTAGNIFFFPSTTGTTNSAVSKPETLILNGQAKRNTTTKEKSPKAGQFTNAVQAFEHQLKMQEALMKMQLAFGPDEPVAF